MSEPPRKDGPDKLQFREDAIILEGKIDKLQAQNEEQQRKDQEYKARQLKFNFVLTASTVGLLVMSLIANIISGFMAVATKNSAEAAKSAAEAAKSANRINRESLESVQRAFITFQKMNYTRVVDRDGHAYWDFNATWENTGTTPAIEVRKVFAVSELAQEPNNDEFRGPAYRADQLTTTTIGPKGLQDSGKLKKPDSFIFGIQTRAVPLSRRYTFTNKRKLFFWGWAAYRDVFRETPPRITEFCYQLTEVLVSDDPGHRSIFSFEACDHHNCVDQYCEDYQTISLTTPKTGQSP